MSALPALKKIFIIFIFFLSYLLTFITLSSFSYAANFAGYVQDCDNTAECATLYGGNKEDWLCTNNVCVENRQNKYWYEPQSLMEFQQEYYGLPEDEVSDQRFSARIFSNIINTANLSIIGKSSAAQEGIRYQPFSGGAISLVSSLITSTYARPPASGIDYLANLGKNLGIPSAYAQTGIGAKGLQPILPLWNAFKNIAYIFYILIFIVTGLMIMFRKKISPQAVITIENALPGIIVSLIAVTFSYAIAGFLIDTVYVLINLAILVSGISGLIKVDQVNYLQTIFVNNGFPEVIRSLLQIVGGSGQALSTIGGGIAGLVQGATAGFFSAISGILGAAVGVLILGCIILYVLFKLFLSLLSAYISVIINIILSPILLMMSALPGSKSGGVGKWITDLLSDLLIFPAIAGYLVIGKGIVDNVTLDNLWSPPLLASGGILAKVFPTLISFGLLLYINKIPEMIKKLFDEKYKKGPGLLAEQVGFIPGLSQTLYTKGKELPIPALKELEDKRRIKEAGRKKDAEDAAQAEIAAGNRSW